MRWMTWKTLVVVLIAAVATMAAAACDNTGVAGPALASSPSASELTTVVVSDEVLSGQMLSDAMASSFTASGNVIAGVTSTLTGTFTRTRDCPAGGTVQLVGSLTRTRDNDTTTWNVSATRTRTSCTHAPNDSVTIALTGTSSYSANRMKVSGAFYGDQTSSGQGSFHWVKTNTNTNTTKQGDCDFSVQAVRDPVAHTLHVTGTVCGRTIDRTVSWDGNS